jgi:hypothetical protein
VKDDNLNSLYGKIKCPPEEMNMVLQKVPLPMDTKKIIKRPNLWDSIFTEEVKSDTSSTPSHSKTKQQIICKKPNILKAFD